MAKAETGNLSKKSGYYDVLDASAYDVLAKAVTERMGAVLEEMHDGKLLKYDSEKELDKQLTSDAENDEYPSALLAAKKFEDVYGKLGEKISETDKTNEISENNKNKLPTVGAMTDYIDSVMPEGENRDATLLAMYNEILKPSPAEWFTVSGDTIMGFNMDNEDFNNATLLVFPYEINGVGIRHLDIDAWWDIVGKGVGVELRRNSNIKKVIIPNCIKDMQGEYFGQIFPNMASVNIPTGCASIGKGFFKGCAVKNITIPESVTQIGSEALNIGIAVNPGCVTVLNPDCKIDGSAFGIQPNVIIKGYTGSTAEKVAESLGAHFVSLEGAEFAEIESEMGDIDAALDGIIAIQNNFIGGESA